MAKICFVLIFLSFYSVTVFSQVLFKAGEGQKVYMPRYDGKGNKVAFFLAKKTNIDEQKWSIYIFDRKEKKTKEIANEGMDIQLAGGLSWSEDDKSIYFTALSDECKSDFLCSFIVKIDANGSDKDKELNELIKSKKGVNLTKDLNSTCFGIDVCRCKNCDMRGNFVVSFFRKVKIIDKRGRELKKLIDLKKGSGFFHSPRWSANCEKIGFELWERDFPQKKVPREGWEFKSGIYLKEVRNSKTITKIEDVKSNEVYKAKNKNAFSPNFTLDGLTVIYSVEEKGNGDFGLLFENKIYCPRGLGCSDVSNYSKSIIALPPTLVKGEKSPYTSFNKGGKEDYYGIEREFREIRRRNEIITNLEQCSFCNNRKIVYISRNKNDLYAIGEFSIDESTRINNKKGGLIFLKGKLEVIIPHDALQNNTVDIIKIHSYKQNVFDEENWIMKVLDNSIIDFNYKNKVFKKKARLFFHYDDMNNDGYIDSVSYKAKEDSLSIYFYDEVDKQWVKGDFKINFKDNYISVLTNKLYKYCIFIGMKGYFPPLIKQLYIFDLKGYLIDKGKKGKEIVFKSRKVLSDGNIRILLKIYNQKNRLVRSLFFPEVEVRHLMQKDWVNLGNWDLKDKSGKVVKKGIYKYKFSAQDKLNTTKFEAEGEINIK